MPDLITLTCPSCGAKLKVTDQIHLLACRNCGNEHMVVRDTSSIYLAPLAQDVRGIRVGVDKTAAELAVARLTREIELLEAEKREVWQVANAKLNDSKQERSWGSLGIILLILAAITTTGFLFWLAVAILVLVLLSYLNRRGKAISLRNAETQRINAEIAERQPRLTKNRQIAES